MNDITPKEAIANLNHLYGMVAPDIQRSIDVAIKALERPQGEWADNDPPEKSEQAKGEPFTAVCDYNDGIFDPTYINDEVDCTDLGIYPWGNS